MILGLAFQMLIFGEKISIPSICVKLTVQPDWRKSILIASLDYYFNTIIPQFMIRIHIFCGVADKSTEVLFCSN